MESIYNLVPVEVEVPVKPPLYRSRHDPKLADIAGSTIGIQGTSQLPGAGKAVKKSSANFGPRDRRNPDPSSFLKSGSRIMAGTGFGPEKAGTFQYSEPERKAFVPRATERPIMGLTSNKNYITANAVEAILQVPQRVTDGDPNYLAKADYGKVPEYLGQVKEEIRRENQMIDAYVTELSGGRAEEKDSMELMDEGERLSLLRALKAKWDAVNSKYQRMCHQTKLDTMGKIKRKETFEKELDALEADIKLLATRGAIGIAN